MDNALSTVSGQSGFIVYSDTNAHTSLHLSALVVNADAVLTELKVNGTSVLSARGLSGVTIKGGMYLPAGSGYITDLTLASGSVIGY